MNAQKICGLFLNVCTLILGLSLVWANPLQQNQQPMGTSTQIQSADGGGPVPPRPPADGSLVADGGGPVPPRPPADGSVVADGGGPVPPRPPQFLNAGLLEA